MKFNKLYNLLMEKKPKGLISLDADIVNKKSKEEKAKIDPDTGKRNPVLDSKEIPLQNFKVELQKQDKDGEFFLEIKLPNDDSSATRGNVEYDTKEALDDAYDSLNTMGEVLNYMNLHMKEDSSAFGWANIMKKAKSTIAKLTPKEINDLNLDFNIGVAANPVDEYTDPATEGTEGADTAAPPE